jgi:site-specific DNA recombinase
MTTTTRAAIYARISQDGTGQEQGVQRQLDDCRKFAEDRGWEVLAEYSDNDISAFKGQTRPGYDNLMADVRARRVDAVIVFQSSRLWRDMEQLSSGVAAFNKAGVRLVESRGQEFDLSTSTGFMNVGLAGLINSWESRVKSERVTAAAQQRAERGDPNGAVPFGWRREYTINDRGQRIGSHDVLDPVQAPVVAEVCRRLLAGESLHGVTTWLNESGVEAPGATFDLRHRGRGLTNPDGNAWGKTSVRKLALRAQNCGMRQYHKGRPDERLLPMKAEPIITRDEWERLTALLTAPERVSHKDGSRKHLLSYCRVGVCGMCGGPLRVATIKGRYGKPQTLYSCIDKGCVGRNQAYVDTYLREVVVGRLSMPDARDLLAVDDTGAKAARDEAAGYRARLDKAADQFAEGLIDAEQMARITARLRQKMTEANKRAQEASPGVPLELLDEVVGDHAAERWDALTVVQQQRLVNALFNRIAIMPTPRRGPGFDPSTVALEWRQ